MYVLRWICFHNIDSNAFFTKELDSKATVEISKNPCRASVRGRSLSPREDAQALPNILQLELEPILEKQKPQTKYYRYCSWKKSSAPLEMELTSRFQIFLLLLFCLSQLRCKCKQKKSMCVERQCSSRCLRVA